MRNLVTDRKMGSNNSKEKELNEDLERIRKERIARERARDLFELLDLDGDHDGVITMREVGKAFRGKRKGRRTSSRLLSSVL